MAKIPDVFKKEDLKGPIVKRMMRIITAPIAIFLAEHTKITPNQITAFTAILSFIAGYFFYIGTHLFLTIGAAIFFLRFMLDFVDGSLARLKGIASQYGHWLDNSSDELGKFIIFFSMSLGVWRLTGSTIPVLLGFAAFSGYILSSLEYNMFWRFFPFAEDVVENEKGKRKYLKQLFFIDPLITLLILAAALSNQVYAFLALTAAYSWLFCIAEFIALSSKIVRHVNKK